MRMNEVLSRIDEKHSDGHTFNYNGKKYPIPYQTITIDGVTIPGLRDVDKRVQTINAHTLGTGTDAYLDIGCNLGMITVGVGARFKNAWGIDRERHYIDLCRAIHMHSAVEWDCCEVENMRVGHMFDLVTALSMIENVSVPEAFINKVHCMVAAGGAFVLEGHSADISSGKWRTWDSLLRGCDWCVELLSERGDPGCNSPYKDGRPIWVCRKE